MSTPTGGSQLWTATSVGSPGQGQGPGQTKQSPAKAVAGALKRLFRIPSTDKQLPEGLPPSPPASPKPAVSPPRTKPLDHPKPASFKHQGSFEPGSVLDYDDRFSMATTERASAITGSERASIITDRASTITDRASVVTDRSTVNVERTSSMPLADRASGISRQSSRNSGSSRLGTYIRSLIKQPSTTSPTGQAPGSPTGLGAQHLSASLPDTTSSPAPAMPSPQSPSSSAPRHASFALGTQPAGSTSPVATAFRSPPGGSPSAATTPTPGQTISPRQLTESVTLLPPSPAAIARMQRDPNLLTVCNDLPPAMDRPAWRVEDYTLLQKIHAGYASAVYKAYCRLSGQTVALKVYQPAKLHEISQFQLYREARLHTQMSHPNIIKLYAAFRNGDAVILVQEFADGGDLLQLLMQHGTRLSERRATQLVLQPLLRALYYLHSRFITHRDVKLENILFMGREMTLKLADFGLCLNLREERSVTRAGTLDYMAPEVLRCPQKHKPQDNKDRLDLAYTMTVDIWATGVVAYELLNGCPPFTCHDKKETEKRISSGLMPEFVVDVSDSARDFVYSCLASNADMRPTAWQLLRYSWIKAGTRNSTSVLMDAMAARRVAAGSPASMAPLADVHIGEGHDEEVNEAAQVNTSPAPRAGAAALASAPSPVGIGAASPSSSPVPQYQAQAQSPALPQPSEAVPTRMLTGNIMAGNRVSTPTQRNTPPPQIDVNAPTGSRLQAPGDTGELSPQHAPAHRPFPPGNLGSSGPLLPSSKSSQPLLSTSALLQQMPNVAGAAYVSHLAGTVPQARAVAGTSSISTRTSAPSPKQQASWQTSGSSSQDNHEGTGTSGLSPIATRMSGSKGLGKSPSPTRPGQPSSPAASPQVPTAPLPAAHATAGLQQLTPPSPPALPVDAQPPSHPKATWQKSHKQRRIAPAPASSPSLQSHRLQDVINAAAAAAAAAAAVTGGLRSGSHKASRRGRVLVNMDTFPPRRSTANVTSQRTRDLGQTPERHEIPGLSPTVGDPHRSGRDSTTQDVPSPRGGSPDAPSPHGSLEMRASMRSTASDTRANEEQRVSDVLRQAFRSVGLSRRPMLPRWDGVGSAWPEGVPGEGREDSPTMPTTASRIRGRRSSALEEVANRAASRSAQLVASLLHERATFRPRQSGSVSQGIDGVVGAGSSPSHTVESPTMVDTRRVQEREDKERPLTMRASAPQLMMSAYNRSMRAARERAE